MKVLQVTKKFPFPLHDGEAWAVKALAEGLHLSGSLIDLFSTTNYQIGSISDHIETLKKSSVYDQVFVHHQSTQPTFFGAFANLFTNVSYHAQRFSDDNTAKILSSVISIGEYDVVIAESAYSMANMKGIRKTHPQILIILRAHNAEHLIWERYALRFVGLKRWYFNLQSKRLRDWEGKLLDDVNALITVSSKDLSVLSSNSKLDVPSMVLPIGFELNASSRLNDEYSPFIIGFIGSLDWRPNVEGLDYFLAIVWPELLKQNEDMILMIAGKNAHYHKKYSNLENVTFLGEISDSSMFIAQLDAFIIPLWSGSGTRVKLLQSLSIGTPVVSTSIGAEGLKLQHGVEFLHAESTEEWVDAIRRIRENEDIVRYLEDGGKKYIADQHNIQHLGLKLSQFIEGLCPSK